MENAKNVTITKEGTKLVITCDLAAPGELSASGKSRVHASTKGNVDVGDGFKLGLNLYKPAK